MKSIVVLIFFFFFTCPHKRVRRIYIIVICTMILIRTNVPKRGRGFFFRNVGEGDLY
jgi:hypothetical protein